jgi:hypothetical protein
MFWKVYGNISSATEIFKNGHKHVNKSPKITLKCLHVYHMIGINSIYSCLPATTIF